MKTELTINEKQVEKESEKFDLIETLEIGINTINHGLIAITTFYITWYAFSAVGFIEYQTYHAWFTTMGYQLFMSEGIMAMYSRNTYTVGVESRVWKKRVHWALSAIGSGFAVYGISMQIYHREITGRTHFHNTHGISGNFSFNEYFFSIE
jgi:hypothetical protein